MQAHARHTFWMMGKIASVFEDEDEADARPLGRCESGTRTGLCLRDEFFFFCDLPMAVGVYRRVRRTEAKLERCARRRARDAIAKIVHVTTMRDLWRISAAVSAAVRGHSP
jgi:hypothetical protein